MKSVNITSKNFGGKLSGVIRSATSMRAKLQNLMLFGMEHYAKNGDTGYLDRCMESCVGVAALPTQKMKVFIQEHANVSWKEVEIKSGKDKGKKVRVFKKRGKEATYKEPTINWWEFSVAGDAQPDMDVAASVISLIKRIDKKLADKHIKNEKEAKEYRHELVKLSEKHGHVLTA